MKCSQGKVMDKCPPPHKKKKKKKLVSELVLMPVRKSLCIKISSAVIYYDREFNLVLKCRQMSKLSCGKKINRG